MDSAPEGISALHKALENEIINNLPYEAKELIYTGWAYKDLPKMRKVYYDYIVEAAGADQIKHLTVAKYEEDNGEWWRGQILISPQGRANISEYIKTHPIPKGE